MSGQWPLVCGHRAWPILSPHSGLLCPRVGRRQQDRSRKHLDQVCVFIWVLSPPSSHSPEYAAHLKSPIFPEAQCSLNTTPLCYSLTTFWLILIKLERGALKWSVKSPGNQWLTVGISLIKVTLPILARRRAAGQSSDEWERGFVLSLRILLYQREVELWERLSITVVLQLQEQDRARLKGETGENRSLCH